MLPRHRQILEYVRQHGDASVDALARVLGVTTQTIRRDIRQLEDERLLARYHGGVGLPSSVENIDYERLEVSSPGLDRPLKKEADFVRFAGKLAKIKTRMPIEQQKKFTGRLAGVEEDSVKLDVDGRIMAIPFANIDKARLEPEF